MTWFGSHEVQSIFALLVTGFLLLGAVRTVLELQVTRSRRRNTGSDADQLARQTRIPGLIWVGLFLAVSLTCTALGGHLLGLYCLVGCA